MLGSRYRADSFRGNLWQPMPFVEDGDQKLTGAKGGCPWSKVSVQIPERADGPNLQARQVADQERATPKEGESFRGRRLGAATDPFFHAHPQSSSCKPRLPDA